MTGAAPEPLLQLETLNVRFGAVEALVDFSCQIPCGEVAALFGDNGAGKTTLVKVVSGLLRPSSGKVVWDGKEEEISSPCKARELGIEMVYQDLAVCPDLSVSQNIFLGREAARFGWCRYDHMSRRSRGILAELGADIDPERTVGELSGGQRQAVAIARVLLSKPRLVLLDEPTAAISVRQVRELMKLIRRLREAKVAVLVISHRISEIFEICDHVMVLKHGQKAADCSAREISVSRISEIIAGAQEAV